MITSINSALKAGSATVVIGIALIAAPVYAQNTATATTPAPAAADDSKDAEAVIVVTGSSIKRANLETPSPLQILNQSDLVKSGYDSIAAALTNLTANGAGTLSANNSVAFAGGASGIALRGLSVGDTLTLIDGHRLAPYPLSDDGERQFTDVASIPFSAIESVDILKDGASAIYGSDAIAGVVNIHLKKQITGVEMMAEGGLSQHGGGATQHYGISAGQGDLGKDGYNVYMIFEYRKQDAITLAQRQNEPWGSNNFTQYGGNNLAAGAYNAITAPFPSSTRFPYAVTPGLTAVFPNGGCASTTALQTNQCTSSGFQNLESPTRNISFVTGVTKDFDGGWEVKARLSFFDSKDTQTNGGPYENYQNNYPGASYGGQTSNPRIGVPMAAVGAIGSFTLPAQYGALAGDYLEGAIPGAGYGTIYLDSQTVRFAVDTTGNIGGWDVTGSAGISEVETHEKYVNFVNTDTLYTDITIFNSAGQPLFNPFGGNSQAAINAIEPTFSSLATDRLYYIDASATRKLFDLPGGDLHVAAGVDFFDKSLNNPGAVPVLDGSVGGTFSTYASGSQSDIAEYAEVDAKMFNTLEINAAVRDDHYNTYGNSITPKAGFTWKPVSSLLLRGTFSKGFRAPDPAESGKSGTVFGLGAAQDPVLCPNGPAGPFPAGTVQNACAANPAYIQTTNSQLKPETSTSFTGGAVLTPLRGLSFTADYYHIDIKHQIISAAELPTYSLAASCVRGPALPIAGVYTGVGTTTTTAVPLAGPLDACFAGYVNAQTTKTSGIDLEAHYQMRFGQAKITASATYTHIINYDLTSPTGQTYHLAGTHGPAGVSGDTGNPRDHINATIAMDYGQFSAAVSGYWISSYSANDPSEGQNTCAEALATGYMFGGIVSGSSTLTGAQQQFCRIKSFTSINLTAQYRATQHLTLNFAVQNLFDATAPIDPVTYAGSFTPYNPSLHEDGVIGRFFKFGVDYKY